jgi:hypothetical protein
MRGTAADIRYFLFSVICRHNPLLDEVIVEETDGYQPQLHGRVRQANSRIDGNYIGPASARTVGKIVYVAGDLTTLGAKRIDAGSFAKRQIISQ